uniref:Eukaryotic elongation factor 2 lysine methyltransferase n=1 Tax=Hippocampus comes TaxID=109280 RepID=A0A3Q3D8T9_HIPCM
MEPVVSTNFHSRKQNRSDILKQFQSRYFATSRLVSFPWTVCKKYQTYPHTLLGPCFPQPCGNSVSLLENVALISEGTTGLVTWEAALYLAEWALDHAQIFAGRKVLELGSGAGLTGVAVCHSCAPSSYVFSDCHQSVLQRLRDNLSINGLLNNKANTSRTEVRVQDLDWTDVTEERLNDIGADVVIAADVVYDPDVIAVLVQLLSKILKRGGVRVPSEVFVCSTVRNPQTYTGFRHSLSKIMQPLMLIGELSP